MYLNVGIKTSTKEMRFSVHIDAEAIFGKTLPEKHFLESASLIGLLLLFIQFGVVYGYLLKHS
jgi:hypothetical protein